MKPRDPEKERALFEATLRLAEQGSLAELTVQRIAREAGLAVGTVYVYFPGKEELLRRLYLHTKGHAVARMVQGYSDQLPFRQGFRLLSKNYFEFLISERREVAFQEKYFRSGLLDETTLEQTRAASLPIDTLITRGQDEELIKPWDRGSLLRFVLAVLKDGASQALSMAASDRDACFERTLQFCLDGLAR